VDLWLARIIGLQRGEIANATRVSVPGCHAFGGLSVDKAYNLIYNGTIFKNEGTELCADVNIFNLTIKI